MLTKYSPFGICDRSFSVPNAPFSLSRETKKDEKRGAQILFNASSALFGIFNPFIAHHNNEKSTAISASIIPPLVLKQ